MKKLYTAITGDLVKSREIPNRSKVQAKLQKVLDGINKQFRDVVVVKFSIILGDEFQGLTSSVEKSYDIIKELQKSLYPVRVSFGVGVGLVSTKIMKKTTEIDGKCFVLSRDALQKAKETKQSIVYYTGNSEKDIAINTISMLMDTIRKNWKNQHYKRIWEYEEFGSQQAAAKKNKISQQMISKILNTTNYFKIKNAEQNIRNLLSL